MYITVKLYINFQLNLIRMPLTKSTISSACFICKCTCFVNIKLNTKMKKRDGFKPVGSDSLHFKTSLGILSHTKRGECIQERETLLLYVNAGVIFLSRRRLM